MRLHSNKWRRPDSSRCLIERRYARECAKDVFAVGRLATIRGEP